VKYMILTYASQRDYDEMTGAATGTAAAPSGPAGTAPVPAGEPAGAAMTAADLAALGAFMESFNRDLAESGELVETRALIAPVHTRRVQLRDGVPVVTDGPYAETQEVLAGYWIVDCDGYDRATEVAARLAGCPAPPHLAVRAYADVRPLADSRFDLDG